MTRLEFWLKPKTWPRDPAGWVFLARAVRQIGVHLFPGRWNEAVPAAQQGSDQRFKEVQDSIVVAAAAGRVRTGLRLVAGGEVNEIPAQWWNTETLGPRFTMCQMKPTDPFGAGFAGNGYCWIFIDAVGLDRLISPEDRDSTTAAEAPRPIVDQTGLDHHGTLPPVREKMKSGAPGYDKQWWTIEPIAREIYREIEPYDRSVGITQAHLIRQMRERIAQDHPEITVSDTWLKRKLRSIGL